MSLSTGASRLRVQQAGRGHAFVREADLRWFIKPARPPVRENLALAPLTRAMSF